MGFISSLFKKVSGAELKQFNINDINHSKEITISEYFSTPITVPEEDLRISAIIDQINRDMYGGFKISINDKIQSTADKIEKLIDEKFKEKRGGIENNVNNSHIKNYLDNIKKYLMYYCTQNLPLEAINHISDDIPLFDGSLFQSTTKSKNKIKIQLDNLQVMGVYKNSLDAVVKVNNCAEEKLCDIGKIYVQIVSDFGSNRLNGEYRITLNQEIYRHLMRNQPLLSRLRFNCKIFSPILRIFELSQFNFFWLGKIFKFIHDIKIF